ncbi:MAG TPA: glycosyltransferase, partial [Ornithinibacter sp.]|nr:glycosyltransferase [Ornithinibacter sp.]
MVELAGAGLCPNIARLLAEGAAVETVAPYGTFVGSLWKTVATGLEVGHHRYYNWVQPAEHEYDVRSTSPREALGTPFWETLSARGRSVAVLDVPHAEVPSALNGVLLKEWGCHDRHHGTGSFPPELVDELQEVAGGHPYGTCPPPGGDDQFAPCDYTLRAGAHRTLDEERRLFALITAGVEAKRRASMHLLARGGWDLFVSVVGESHCVGHQLWHVHDPDHPRHDPAAPRLFGDPVVEVYRRLDALVGEHLAAVGPETTCYVHLSHGMQSHFDGDHLLDEVLLRLDEDDRAGVPTGWRTRLARPVFDRARGRVLDALRQLVGVGLRQRIAAAPPTTAIVHGPRADRRWYWSPNNTVVSAVRFNVRGREPAGLVSAGPELDALREVVERGLLELVNVDTGRPAVRRVVRAEEVLERSAGDAFPDLFVEWDRTAPIERVWSPRIGTVAAPYEHWRTGDHNDRGLLLAVGPGIAPGRRAEPMDLVQLAPTLSAAVGEHLTGVDASPRVDLLPGPAAAHPVLADATERAAPSRPRVRDVAADASRIAEGALDLAHVALAKAEAAEGRLDRLDREASELRAMTHQLRRAGEVWATMAWLDGVEVDEDRLITVVTPTYERPGLLAQAIRSVVAQTYGRWEMLVVDDGGDTAKTVVAEVGDERVRALRIPHSGPAAARNAALRAATGTVITYLDDDNVLDRGWLKAVAWAFQHHPDHDVLYGARLIDDHDRVHGLATRGWPWLQLNAFDRDRLREGNLADMGVIAHTAGLAEAHFDERLWEYADWDLFLALTEHRTPLELPAIAVRYRTSEGERLSGEHPADRSLV